MYNTREQLAKSAIEYFLKNRQIPHLDPQDVSVDMQKIIPCFVTVYVKGNLRGCIGNYETDRPLFENILKMAVSAAFSDFRFSPITSADLPNLTIEVSCLSAPSPYIPTSSHQLLSYLVAHKPGLIISSGYHKALFLPQVWKELPDPEEFLSRLCLKAGLPENAWKDIPNISFMTFTVY